MGRTTYNNDFIKHPLEDQLRRDPLASSKPQTDSYADYLSQYNKDYRKFDPSKYALVPCPIPGMKPYPRQVSPGKTHVDWHAVP